MRNLPLAGFRAVRPSAPLAAATPDTPARRSSRRLRGWAVLALARRFPYRAAMARIETPRAVRGTQDMLGEAAARFGRVVDTFGRVRRLYGFGRVEVPVFEATAVFARSLGETTDVVSK